MYIHKSIILSLCICHMYSNLVVFASLMFCRWQIKFSGLYFKVHLYPFYGIYSNKGKFKNENFTDSKFTMKSVKFMALKNYCIQYGNFSCNRRHAAAAVTTCNSNKSHGIYLKAAFITVIVACIAATNQGLQLFMGCSI